MQDKTRYEDTQPSYPADRPLEAQLGQESALEEFDDDDGSELEFDEGEIGPPFYTSQALIENALAKELGAAAPSVLALVLSGAASLNYEPLDMRVLVTNGHTVRHLVDATQALTRGSLMTGPVFDQTPNLDAPVWIEILKQGQAPELPMQLDLDERPSCVFLQVADEIPPPAEGVVDFWIESDSEQADALRKWHMQYETSLAQGEGYDKEIPHDLLLGFLNMGTIGQDPLLDEVIEHAESRFGSGVGSEIRATIGHFAVASLCVTGTDDMEEFLRSDLDVHQRISSFLARAGAVQFMSL